MPALVVIYKRPSRRPTEDPADVQELIALLKLLLDLAEPRRQRAR